MKKYLSIGEVSKLMGVSVKSLRYYGELGILEPAYINQQTGYRYYLMEQMVIVDLICICLEFDIPLKNFHSYIKENSCLNMEKILNDGKKIVDEKSARLRRTLGKLESISKHLSVSKVIKKNNGEYSRVFKERYLLTYEWNGDITDIPHYVEISTRLYKISEKRDLQFLYNRGALYFYKESKIQKLVFIEVAKPNELYDDIFVLPKGKFNCEIFLNKDIIIAEEKYIKNKYYPQNSVVLAREFYDTRIESQPTSVEIQVFVP